MTEQESLFYKSQKGYDAMKQWYDALLSSFDFPHELTYLDTRYGKTHAIVAGDAHAPPLILVQGLAGNAVLWYHQLPAFAEKFRVFALDIPGQPGRSDLNPPPFTRSGYAGWLVDVLDALGYASANFLAVSTGGWFMAALMLAHPGRVAKSILVSPTGFIRARIPYKIVLINIMNKRKSGQLSLERETDARKYFPEKGVKRFDRELAKSMALSTRHFRLQRSVGVVHESTGKVIPRKGLSFLRNMFGAVPKKHLRRITHEALVVLGDREVLYKAHKLQRKLKRVIPSFRVEVIPDSGHSVVFDQYEDFNRMALEYLLE
jgi:pimeloyl-ACP methyl ester carboxylesterase